jgi:dTDP-4-amino-4,6-dideoxygalactose transaminase
MTYFTTMNLPAPTHRHFLEKLDKYWGRPQDAIEDFRMALEAFFDIPKAITWTNCFTATALILMHASRGRSKKVAVSGLAYRRTADIVMWAGLEPVFVDNSLETLAMDLGALRETLRLQDIGCILMQHPMVNLADVDSFAALAEEFAVPLVFDSVEATGGYYRGERIGKFGFAEVFSLHPSKVINAAEGGVLTFGSTKSYATFRASMEALGIMCPETGRQLYFGLEPVHAVMGLASLEIYEDVTALHKKQYQYYEEHMRNLKSLELVKYDEKSAPNYKSVLVKFKTGAPEYRARMMEHLETFGIGARRYYSPLHSKTHAYDLPNARILAEHYMILPIGHSVTLPDIESICAKIREFENATLGRNNA